ncbi:MAG: DinB family protein [Rhodothermales bacterium]
MKETADKFRDLVENAAQSLLKLSTTEAAGKPAPDKWSPKEIIGHLIDSACNNHSRFVRAQLQDHMVFDGYDQVAWVQLQGYQALGWHATVTLWAAYNMHLAAVIERIDDSVAHRKISRHNLHEIAWKTVPQNEPATLAYFVEDYIAHMHHHLKQILD